MKAEAGVAAKSPAAIHAAIPESSQRRHMRNLQAFNIGALLQLASMQLASGFGPVDAERIEFRDLMQEALLRRNRDDHASVDQQDGLAKLQIPVPQRQPLAFERGNGKIRPLEKIKH